MSIVKINFVFWYFIILQMLRMDNWTKLKWVAFLFQQLLLSFASLYPPSSARSGATNAERVNTHIAGKKTSVGKYSWVSIEAFSFMLWHNKSLKYDKIYENMPGDYYHQHSHTVACLSASPPVVLHNMGHQAKAPLVESTINTCATGVSLLL